MREVDRYTVGDVKMEGILWLSFSTKKTSSINFKIAC